ncbi:Uncharacterized conserved protein (DUF2358) [Seminavis robusta]|uniref:Uncharacterized conserved protein (DUF2358) n=1 Tax=Seminavis robusta TaxID=568900 RepID=A0A9N8DPW1_9STRA|nr:Uncharacterized conserved protein (DUF2358) [Seminavis robusta]|eukprot:Sro263_g102130.1 Uncharacterized conserved protein (DUF2358) (182) ;mRNA; f:416-961
MTIRKTTTAIALALLWAPNMNQAFQQSHVPVHRPLSALTAVSPGDAAANDSSALSLDFEALDRKNASRKKFGLKPVTPEEFLENEAAVAQMALEQQQRVVELQQQRQSQPTPAFPGFLDKMLDNVLPDTCESNFDCEAPKVCCDFGVSKVCCAGGPKQRSREGELALVPVPVDVMPPNNRY